MQHLYLNTVHSCCSVIVALLCGNKCVLRQSDDCLCGEKSAFFCCFFVKYEFLKVWEKLLHAGRCMQTAYDNAPQPFPRRSPTSSDTDCRSTLPALTWQIITVAPDGGGLSHFDQHEASLLRARPCPRPPENWLMLDWTHQQFRHQIIWSNLIWCSVAAICTLKETKISGSLSFRHTLGCRHFIHFCFFCWRLHSESQSCSPAAAACLLSKVSFPLFSFFFFHMGFCCFYTWNNHLNMPNM